MHDLVARPKLNAARGDFGPIMAIGFPAIMANMATPVGSAYTLRVFSDLGESAIAAAAIIDRVTPVAFGVIFALTGSIGPIIGQNYGARLMGRVQRALTDSFILSIGYVLFAWARSGAGRAGARRRLRGQGRERRICQVLLPIWRLRLAVSSRACSSPTRRSTISAFRCCRWLFNWGRATLGTIPFVTFGARYGGVQGGLLGFALGCAVFGLIAVGAAYAATARLAKGIEGGDRCGLAARGRD